MTDIHAALGLSQLSRLNEFINQRQAIAKRYNMALKELPIKLPYQHQDTFSSYHLYPIRIPPGDRLNQKQVYDGLWGAGIQANLHYIPVYRQPYYQALGFGKDYCPHTEAYFRETISLPIFPQLTKEDQNHIIDALGSLLGA